MADNREEELQRRLREACQALPDPQPERMAKILRHVQQNAHPPRRWPSGRWLGWLLLTGAAAAMAGGIWYAAVHQQQVAELSGVEHQPTVPSAPSPTMNAGRAREENEKPSSEGNNQKEGAKAPRHHALIYKR